MLVIFSTSYSYALPSVFSTSGRKMYYVTWALQYVNLFVINTGYIILAGQAVKVIEYFAFSLSFSLQFMIKDGDLYLICRNCMLG